MKGVLLAGGVGTRLKPCTDVTNKHMLPVYNRPMIYHPLKKLYDSGIRDVLVISGGEHLGDIAEQLKSGKALSVGRERFPLDLTYRVQDNPDGIAGALSLAKSYVGGERFAVILGDNIFQEDLSQYASDFQRDGRHQAYIFLKRVPDANRFGVATVRGGKISGIVEKPKGDLPGMAVTGLYFYTPAVFDVIDRLHPSARGELEITDVNNAFVRKKTLDFRVLSGEWTDAGTPESLYRAAVQVRGKK